MRRALDPILFILLLSCCQAAFASVLVIAHRGASAYLPEHTLAAKVLAFAQGADYLEQDLVLSRDGHLIVFHDLTLERTTDVEARFPDRARPDGRWYVIDFTLAELRELRVSEGTVLRAGEREPQYPSRFPPGLSRFGLHTFEEELELIAGLQASTGRTVGIYPELKAPWFHHREGQDLADAVLRSLQAHGYTTRDRPVYLQSFDHRELRRVREVLLPARDMDLKLVQLIAENGWRETLEPDGMGGWIPADFDWMRTSEGLARLATVVDGIGPAYQMLVSVSLIGNATPNSLRADAHGAGLVVHPYTLRADALPRWANDFDTLLRVLVEDVEVDGLFTDFPDITLAWLRDNLPHARQEESPRRP